MPEDHKCVIGPSTDVGLLEPGKSQGLWRMEIDISQQDTLQLPFNDTFRAYMERYRLTWVAVARASGLRVMTVWRMWSDLPVRTEDAMRARIGIRHLTGYAYPGPILTYRKF
ncbi:hypothetical protein EPA93_35380 [Ktedonosporobacter rubrisoli]|uniref:Uncharacterized protein n=1 Tax=Ktedonosporobacter rubrisoli TaxID=2509675 RepID=A0A4P6JZ03_KTERU|nr:hypothetical protein [Ktedonosporobacter rubrisoli]QBD80969.1 hypothetical protein EPA93_35380 [Ktedonosporobacter rubrisoli]